MNLRFFTNGSKPASLIIWGGIVLSSFIGELLTRDIVISGRHIAAVTPWHPFHLTVGVQKIDS